MRQKTGHLLVILVIATLDLAACGPGGQDPRANAPVVLTMFVPEARAESRSFTGVVTARVQSNLGFRVPGKITERLVDAGQKIKAGQPLMRIDRNDLSLAITARKEAVTAANAQAVQAIADEKRFKALSELSAASQQTYEQAKAAADSARAQLAAAEAQAQIAKNEGDYSILLADADGTVVDTLAEPGQVVGAGQTVVKLAHAGPREASVELPETVRPALESTAEATLYGDQRKQAIHLRQLSDSANPETRTFEARYVLEGDMAEAPLGATITVFLPLKGFQKTMEVPLAAVTDEGKGPGVWVANSDSTVSFHPVEIAFLTEETAVLRGGVSDRDKIVALGAHLLHEGEKIRSADAAVSR